jgi:glutathione S-transferase
LPWTQRRLRRASLRSGRYPGPRSRLSQLSNSLGEKPYLDGNRFTAGDLTMTTVLRSLHHTDVVAPDKRLAAYVERCASRPAFKRALDAHLQDFQSPT